MNAALRDEPDPHRALRHRYVEIDGVRTFYREAGSEFPKYQTYLREHRPPTLIVWGHPAFGWTLLAALCVLLAHAAFWIWLAPVNTTVAASTLATLPDNWMALRSQ